MKLKIFTYNTCYGLKSNSLWKAYDSTYRVVHKRKDPKEIMQKSNFDEVFEIIKSENPNIIVLNEIFDNLQTEDIIRKLKENGYPQIYVGNSGHHEIPLKVSTIIATHLKSKEIKNNIPFAIGIPGTGGGAIGIEFSDLETFLLGIHTPVIQKYLMAQIPYIDKLYQQVKDKYKRVIFTGDFNRAPEFYAVNSEFGKELLATKIGRTFPSFFPIYAPLSKFVPEWICAQVDQFFYKGLEPISAKTIDGKRSDHKPIIAEFELK